MTGSRWWDLLIGIAAGLAVTWLALVVTLAIARPRGGLLREALRLLPDVLRLVRRLSADPDLPRGVRLRLALLLAYLAVPLDLVPDFIPVLGYADDAIIVTAVLRSVVRRAGLTAVRRHWPEISAPLGAAGRPGVLGGSRDHVMTSPATSHQRLGTVPGFAILGRGPGLSRSCGGTRVVGG